MPLDAWFAAFAETEAPEAVATAAEAATAAEVANAANAAATANELSMAGSGITQATTEELAKSAAAGGEGAGGVNVQNAMQNAMQNASTGASNQTMPEATRRWLQASTAGASDTTGSGIVSDSVSGTGVKPLEQVASQTAGQTGTPLTRSMAGQTAGQTTTPFFRSGPPTEQGLSQFAAQNPDVAKQMATNNAAMSQPSALAKGWDAFTKFAKDSPFITGGVLYTGAYNLGLLDPRGNQMPNQPYNGPLSKYRLSPDFQASSAPSNVYHPSYKSYADGGILTVGGDINGPRNTMNPTPTVGNMDEGGIIGFNEGGVTRYAKGDLTDTLDYYRNMISPSHKAPSSDHGDVGIYYDMDPDTRYQDALTAAQIRQAKLNKRANMQLPSASVMARPTPMGALNLRPPGVQAQQSQSSLDPENAAHGGIMQAHNYSLGGYADGGNPRLLKGPGDGMSDNIPATIADKQPARLADGEFVVPADVVSHLGNGSTDAGAKKLHQMMTRVREARTGNPKQGKEINPNKYMPK